MALRHFLIVYDLRESRRVLLEEFASARRATDAYAAAEEEYRDRSADFEVVLVGADSLETVKVTHSRYFDDERDPMPF